MQFLPQEALCSGVQCCLNYVPRAGVPLGISPRRLDKNFGSLSVWAHICKHVRARAGVCVSGCECVCVCVCVWVWVWVCVRPSMHIGMCAYAHGLLRVCTSLHACASFTFKHLLSLLLRLLVLDSGLSLQAEGHALGLTIDLLKAVLCCSPSGVTAAIDANVTPGLVRALRELRPPPQPTGETAPAMCSDLEAAMTCLSKVMHSEVDHPTGLWKAAFDSGLVPILCNMLRLDDESMVDRSLTLSACLLRITPPGRNGLEARWAKELLRTIMELVVAKAEAAPPAAVQTLVSTALIHKDMLKDIHTWGIEDSLKVLTTHSYSPVAAGAERLLSLVHKKQALEVRFIIPFPETLECPSYSRPLFEQPAWRVCTHQAIGLATLSGNV